MLLTFPEINKQCFFLFFPLCFFFFFVESIFRNYYQRQCFFKESFEYTNREHRLSTYRCAINSSYRWWRTSRRIIHRHRGWLSWQSLWIKFQLRHTPCSNSREFAALRPSSLYLLVIVAVVVLRFPPVRMRIIRFRHRRVDTSYLYDIV